MISREGTFYSAGGNMTFAVGTCDLPKRRSRNAGSTICGAQGVMNLVQMSRSLRLFLSIAPAMISAPNYRRRALRVAVWVAAVVR